MVNNDIRLNENLIDTRLYSLLKLCEYLEISNVVMDSTKEYYIIISSYLDKTNEKMISFLKEKKSILFFYHDCLNAGWFVEEYYDEKGIKTDFSKMENEPELDEFFFRTYIKNNPEL